MELEKYHHRSMKTNICKTAEKRNNRSLGKCRAAIQVHIYKYNNLKEEKLKH